MAAYRALVVDDNVDAAHALGFLIEDLGYLVSYAANGLEAINAAKVVEPHVVLLDLGLPGISGWEVARRIRAEPLLKEATIIAVTGFNQPADRERSAAAGIDHHLVKPVSFEVLRPILLGIKL